MKKIISLILSIILIISSVIAVCPITFAAEKQTYQIERYATGNAYGFDICKVNPLRFYGANAKEDDVLIYYVDSGKYSNMRDVGNIYYANLEVLGIVANTSLTVSNSSYSLSNPLKFDVILGKSNTYKAATGSGTLAGPVPQSGESVDLTVTANVKVTADLSGIPVDSSCSASIKIRLIGYDASLLSEEMKFYNGFNESCWTAESGNAYITAYNNAKSVLDSEKIIQSDIDSAYTALFNARKELVHIGDEDSCPVCNTRTQGKIETKSFSDVCYGTDPVRQSLNLCIPTNALGEVSLMVYIHGGGWLGGDKSERPISTLEYDCKKYGVASASISYRFISLDTHCNDMMNDITAALQKIKDIGRENGINITKLMLWGGSAGAHLSLLYAYSHRDTSPIRPVCVISGSGPTNLTNQNYITNCNLGNEDKMALHLSCLCGTMFTPDTRILAYDALMAVSPVNYASTAVPTLIMQGAKDRIVHVSEAYFLDDALNKNNIPHDLLIFPNSDHDLGASLGTDPLLQPERARLEDLYIQTYLCGGMNHKHTFVLSSKVAPTLTSEGSKTFTCSCGNSFTESVPALDYGFTPVESRGVVIDNTKKTVSGLTTGITSLDGFMNCKNCTMEYVLTSNGFGTGTVANFVKNGKVFDSVTVLIYGDVTGDSYTDSFDVALASSAANFESEFEAGSVYEKAADVYKDGFVDAIDITFLSAAANFEIEIEQS